MMKKFRKSVKIWQSYGREYVAYFFGLPCTHSYGKLIAVIGGWYQQECGVLISLWDSDSSSNAGHKNLGHRLGL